jgi:hypothetical protein
MQSVSWPQEATPGCRISRQPKAAPSMAEVWSTTRPRVPIVLARWAVATPALLAAKSYLNRIPSAAQTMPPAQTPAHLIPVQDAGLQTYLRNLDIRFTQRSDLVAG